MIRLALALAASTLFVTSACAIVGEATPGNEEVASRVVAVVGKRGTVCSGTAIGRDLVLTAGHCVQPGDKYQVLEFGGARRPQATAVTSFEQHPQFHFDDANAARPTPDIAVLKLAKPLSKRVRPIALGDRDFFPAGDHFTVAGFGSVGDLNDGTFGRLLAADLTAVRRQSDLQLRLVDPATRGEAPGMSACSGDSGGPVFEQTSTGLVIVGVVSWAASATGAAGCGGITGATPLSAVRPWISDMAHKLGSPLVARAPGGTNQARATTARTQSALRR